ncbi:MAG: fructosamine kinase family protein [Alphaproteobacteria bacterium]|nr:fructosamine kinase family protein [Alphaproteobacteria bacterium]
MSGLNSRLERALGARVIEAHPLSGGCVAQVTRARLSNGESVVIKQGGSGLALEGWMLGYLKGRLPVPQVLLADPDLLVMEWLDAGPGGFDELAQEHCAELIAALHGHSAPLFGLDRPTVIGGLSQPNSQTSKWLDFFRDQRLLLMAHRAYDEGQLPAATLSGIETLAGRLDRWIEEPTKPALIHGDLWGGNILAGRGRVAGFVDPALYYAHPDIELAFGTLFGTFGPAFFRKYNELRPISPGFFEIRRDLYNLYPLLVHVCLFGGSYLGQAQTLLKRLGL